MQCKDCEPGSKRPAPHPGPRCATHHRAFKKKQKEANHENYVQRTYGLSKGDYARMFLAQGQVCWICRKPSRIRSLAVDHDHETGQVRGLLCRNCNYGLLGMFSIADMERAIDYLRNPPGPRILGELND